MPSVVFEPTTPAFERAKAVHALDCTATVIGLLLCNITVNNSDCRTERLNDSEYLFGKDVLRNGRGQI
jgi:hypothetical protein